MSRDGCEALYRGAIGLSVVCELVFLDHTHLLFFNLHTLLNQFLVFTKFLTQYTHFPHCLIVMC